MPWECITVVQQRHDLVQEALNGRASVASLARKYKVSRKTVYKWLARYDQAGKDGLADRSRKPLCSPAATAAEIADRVLAERTAHRDWGAAKLQARLTLTCADPPCERTVHRILKRAGEVAPKPEPAEPLQRFERPVPNELWQMDFKGPLRIGSGLGAAKASTLSIIDDHSRFSVALQALPNHQLETIWPVIWATFGEYGLPQAILTDNENGLFASHRGGITRWTARLWRLGIKHPRGRPYHPQTQGKVERFHGTLQRAALADRHFGSLEELSEALTTFRICYNHERPHEALGQLPPVTRYRPSERPRPRQMPGAEYPEGAMLRRVTQAGYISLRGCRLHVGEGLVAERVEVRDEGDCFSLLYADHLFRTVRWDELPGACQWL